MFGLEVEKLKTDKPVRTTIANTRDAWQAVGNWDMSFFADDDELENFVKENEYTNVW